MTGHLVGTHEIAEMLGVSRQRVHQITQEDETFPEPTAKLKGAWVWERQAVERWMKKSGRT